MKHGIFIRDAEQISIQCPLCEAWMDEPILHDEPYVRAADPDFRQWLAPAESRRLGKILKRALVINMQIARKCGTDPADAILVGTGLGCMENTERLLETLCHDGEETFSPTHFMQSTHNTIASLMAIHDHAHGYNITYSHKDLSFDLALHDAWTQFRLGKIHSALVGGFDELTPSYFTLLRRIGYLGADGQGPGSEAAAALLLTDDSREAMCEVAAMRILYRPEGDELRAGVEKLLDEAGMARDELDGVITGVNGQQEDDARYERFTRELLPGVPTLRYKHLFGSSYTASAYAAYVAAHCLQKGRIPEHLLYGGTKLRSGRPRALLIVNERRGKEYSLLLLRREWED